MRIIQTLKWRNSHVIFKKDLLVSVLLLLPLATDKNKRTGKETMDHQYKQVEVLSIKETQSEEQAL